MFAAGFQAGRWTRSGAYSSDGSHTPLPLHGTGPGANDFRSFLESVFRVREDAGDSPGLLQLILRALGLDAPDFASLLREPVRKALSDDQQYDLFERLLFPPPDEDQVRRIVYTHHIGLPWTVRIARLSRLARPEYLADTVASGYAMGKSQREIAKDLLPLVDNVRSSAMRVARTEGLRVAHQVQVEMHEQGLGDLITGWQIRATLDQNTRPAHAARNGLMWMKNSGQDMMTTLHMKQPQLPDEPN